MLLWSSDGRFSSGESCCLITVDRELTLLVALVCLCFAARKLCVRLAGAITRTVDRLKYAVVRV